MLSKAKNIFLVNRSTRQTVAKNIFWLTVGQIGTRLIRAFLIVYAARILGAAEYGIFSYVIGLAGFFSVFSDIGINPILTREVAKKPQEAQSIFATSFWIKIVLIFFTALLIIFVAPYFSKIESAKPLLIFAAILTIFDGIREFSIAFFRAREKMELEALITTVTNIAITIFGFVILNSTPTASALAITYAFAAGTGTIIGIFILRKEFGGLFKYFKKELLKPILISAWPIAFIFLIGVFMLNVDIVMLGFLRTAEEVGFYSAGQKIVQLLYVVSAVLAASFYPVFSKLVEEKNHEKTRQLMERGTTISLLLALPLALGGIVLAPEIIQLLYGSEYGPAVLAFQILLLTMISNFLAPHLSNYIMAYDKQKLVPAIVLMGSMANVIFNLILIRPYGPAGAAAATVIAQIIFQGLLWCWSKRINNFYTLRHLKKIILATFVMGLVAVALQGTGAHVLINIAISALAYFATLFLLKEKTIVDVQNFLLRRRVDSLQE